MEETVFLNNEFLPAKQAKISALSPGVLCGVGVFESMRSFKSRIVYFSQHLKRIKNSSQLMAIGFPYSLDRLTQIIRKSLRISGLRDAYVRLSLYQRTQGADILIIVKEYRPFSLKKYQAGFSAGVSRFRQIEDSFLSNIKTTNRALYELSLQEAKNNGFEEAVILNTRGYICEATRSNIFLAKDKALFTPGLECGCLDGVTRKVVFDFAKESKIKLYQGNFTLRDLSSADEAFLTNSLMGVMPLTRVEGQAIANGACGKITAQFRKKYNLLLKNGI